MTSPAIRRHRRREALKLVAVAALLVRLATGPAWPAAASGTCGGAMASDARMPCVAASR
jgi:hypothetical protein